MRTLLDRFSFLVVSLAGWMNQHQQYGIHYLIEENRVLREQIGNRRMRFIKEECLEQMIFFGEDWLRSGVRNFVEYDHHEGNHQGLDNRLVIPMKRTVNTGGRIQRRQRLGGLLNYYCRAAQIILPRYRHLNWLQSTYRCTRAAWAENKALGPMLGSPRSQVRPDFSKIANLTDSPGPKPSEKEI